MHILQNLQQQLLSRLFSWRPLLWTQIMSTLMLFVSQIQRRLLLHPLQVQTLSLAA
jgi:hypothetical protein